MVRKMRGIIGGWFGKINKEALMRAGLLCRHKVNNQRPVMVYFIIRVDYPVAVILCSIS